MTLMQILQHKNIHYMIPLFLRGLAGVHSQLCYLKDAVHSFYMVSHLWKRPLVAKKVFPLLYIAEKLTSSVATCFSQFLFFLI